MQLISRLLLLPFDFMRKLRRLEGRFRSWAYFPGKRCTMDGTVVIKGHHNVDMGMDVRIAQNVLIGARGRVAIGDDCSIGPDVHIETGGSVHREKPPFPHYERPIEIGSGVILCSHAVILGGVKIGDRALIAAGAVVTRDVPAYSTAAGVPAKIIASHHPDVDPDTVPSRGRATT